MNEWCAETLLDKVASKSYEGNNTVLPKIKHYEVGQTIPLSGWLEIREKTIQLVELFGEEYIGIFQRADYEVSKAQESISSLEKMRAISGKTQSEAKYQSSLLQS